MAKVYVVNDDAPAIIKRSIECPEEEYARFLCAKKAAAGQIKKIMSAALEHIGEENGGILDYQLLILEDTDFVYKIREIVYKERVNCEYAVDTAASEYIGMFEKMDNDYLKERTSDIRDVAKRLIFALGGRELATLSHISEDSIVAAADLTPSQTAGIDKRKVKGIVLEHGGISSHSVILARSMGIPCIIGVSDLMKSVVHGETILIDGKTGEVVLSPGGEWIDKLKAFVSKGNMRRRQLEKYKKCRGLTRDGFEMKVYANITSDKEAADLVENGGEGAGLFRTEFLYMARTSPPPEELQYRIYSNAAKVLDGRPLIIRTLDAGGDKNIPYLKIEEEKNPFLGYRAIRYCLDNPEIIKTQVSAALRAGVHGNVSLMIPMIATVDEIRRTKAIINEVKDELFQRGVQYAENAQIGIMVETPAAAFSADILAREADFFSIGTNDLSQYLFAADRMNQKVSALNSPFQPVLLKTVKHICECARRNGIEADICGQAGETPELVPLWVAMGIDNLSVSIPSIPKVRKIICETSKAEALEVLDKVLSMETANEVEIYLKSQFTDKEVQL